MLDERLGSRIIGSFVLGLCVALANRALDVAFARMGAARDTNVLNDLIIGVAAALLAYLWVSRQDVKHALELSKEKLIQEAAQSERKRMALELHDTVCQAHAGTIMHLELAGDSLSEDPAAHAHVHRALQLVRGSMTEMRCALWDLYPEELEKLDLKNTIELLVKDLTADKGLSVQFSLEGKIRRLPLDIEKGLLRISREALSNVVKHAKAREVRIDLFLDSERARLSLRDDGQGFQPDLNAGSFGLTSMQDRTKALGGIWTIHSEPGRGTEVHASIPIPPVTSRRAPMKTPRSIRAVIADDHSIVREGLAAVINREPDMEVVGEARNWSEAVDQVLQNRPNVAVLDLHMRGMEPADGVATLREKFPAAQITIYSAFSTDEEVYQVFSAGARVHSEGVKGQRFRKNWCGERLTG